MHAVAVAEHVCTAAAVDVLVDVDNVKAFFAALLSSIAGGMAGGRMAGGRMGGRGGLWYIGVVL